MLCPQCGAEYDNSFPFCPGCDARNPYIQQPPSQVTRVPQAPPVRRNKKRTSPLVIVLVIVGILGLAVLATVVISVISGTSSLQKSAQNLGQKMTCQHNQRMVDGAIHAYKSTTGKEPTSLNDLIQPETRMLESISTCPSGNKPYIWVDGNPPAISCPNDASHTI